MRNIADFRHALQVEPREFAHIREKGEIETKRFSLALASVFLVCSATPNCSTTAQLDLIGGFGVDFCPSVDLAREARALRIFFTPVPLERLVL